MRFIVIFLLMIWSAPAYADILHERVEYSIKIPVKSLLHHDPKLQEVEALTAQVAVKKGWDIYIQCTKATYCQKIYRNITNEAHQILTKKHTGFSFVDSMLDGANQPEIKFEENAKVNVIKLIGKTF